MVGKHWMHWLAVQPCGGDGAHIAERKEEDSRESFQICIVFFFAFYIPSY